MEAAVKHGVKKIVLTSSMAAITDSPVKKYTEADWNEKSSLTRNPYYYSKTLAEKAAWDFVKDRDDAKDLKLVVINVRSPLEPRRSFACRFLMHNTNVAVLRHWSLPAEGGQAQRNSRDLYRLDDGSIPRYSAHGLGHG
jgi:nucleoside-diphosphate-sugar epimerase